MNPQATHETVYPAMALNPDVFLEYVDWLLDLKEEDKSINVALICKGEAFEREFLDNITPRTILADPDNRCSPEERWAYAQGLNDIWSILLRNYFVFPETEASTVILEAIFRHGAEGGWEESGLAGLLLEIATSWHISRDVWEEFVFSPNMDWHIYTLEITDKMMELDAKLGHNLIPRTSS